jgi:hypothetical protein
VRLCVVAAVCELVSTLEALAVGVLASAVIEYVTTFIAERLAVDDTLAELLAHCVGKGDCDRVAERAPEIEGSDEADAEAQAESLKTLPSGVFVRVSVGGEEKDAEALSVYELE